MNEGLPHPARAWRTLLSAWVPVVGWAALIFAFSAQPDLTFVPDAGVDLVVRKIGHMAVFGILALLIWRALAGTTALRRPWAWALVLTILYAISDELHQGLVAGRHASASDVVIDTIGAVTAVATIWFIRSRGRAERQYAGTAVTIRRGEVAVFPRQVCRVIRS